MDGIGGTDDIHNQLRSELMIQKKPMLWVAFAGHGDGGFMMAADGFYEGSLPVNPAMIARIKTEIHTALQAQLNQVKLQDKSGNFVVGAPKPQIKLVEIRNILPAEIDEDVPVN